jgi:hypothetical protein
MTAKTNGATEEQLSLIREIAAEHIRLAGIKTKGSFWDGWKEAARQYALELPTISDQGTDTFNRIADAIEEASDALADFVMTGKADWEDLTKSILRDLLAIQIKMIAMPLFSGLAGNGGWLSSLVGLGSSLFGGVSAGGGAASAGSGFSSGVSIDSSYANAFKFHKGGMVGTDGATAGPYAASLFLNAPRLHKGLEADEFPAILQRGERVIPKSQADTGTVLNVSVPVTVSSENKKMIAELRAGLENEVVRIVRKYA